MNRDQLEYANLQKIISPLKHKGRTESATFLNWFLENIYRLDEVSADDAICDKPNDKGIDGIYINHNLEEINVFQSKIRQAADPRFGDAPLRTFAGTLVQLETSERIQLILDGGANDDLKKILRNNNVGTLLEKGYELRGVYVTNETLDDNGKEFLAHAEKITVYDRPRIAEEFIDIDSDGGVAGEFVFDVSYIPPLQYKAGDLASAYIFPASAIELTHLNGIDDGTLFAQNVRLSLGNTKVNKAITESVGMQAEHIKFPLFHNGVTILCDEAKLDDGKLSIVNYVVVNGAQSITTFFQNQAKLTTDLRVLVKVIKLADPALGRQITTNSNNQNAIKPRDLRSNHDIQIRLKEEFEKIAFEHFVFEVKRGEVFESDDVVITNEEAGRLLLAFDLGEPETCHQVYKVFDEKYADIFARKEVDAWRIIFLRKLMDLIYVAVEKIDNKPFGGYGLTRFFLMNVLKQIISSDEMGGEVLRNPKPLLQSEKFSEFLTAIDEILCGLIIDLNYEVKELGDAFDYKADMKSPLRIREWTQKLLKSYDKDVARGKAMSLGAALGAKL